MLQKKPEKKMYQSFHNILQIVKLLNIDNNKKKCFLSIKSPY